MFLYIDLRTHIGNRTVFSFELCLCFLLEAANSPNSLMANKIVQVVRTPRGTQRSMKLSVLLAKLNFYKCICWERMISNQDCLDYFFSTFFCEVWTDNIVKNYYSE